MRSRAPFAAGAGGLAFALLLPLAGTGQEPPTGPDPDTVPLVFEREVFHYPEFQRRNPFHPLTGDRDGPRFEELRLLGIILSPDPARSVALLGGAGGGNADRGYRLRAGEGIGNVRILEIQRMRVLVEVEEFGVREQRVMELRMVNDPAPQEMFRPREPVEPPPDTIGAPGDGPGAGAGPPPPGTDDTVEGGRE